jgi:hypothetical protein
MVEEGDVEMTDEAKFRITLGPTFLPDSLDRPDAAVLTSRIVGLADDYLAGVPIYRPTDVTEEEVESAMADSYVSLPITDYASLAAAVNKVLESRYGVED